MKFQVTCIFFTLCFIVSCVSMGSDPENNTVYYGSGEVINVNDEYQYLGSRKHVDYIEDGYGGTSKGRRYIEGQVFVKINDRNNIEELIEVRNVRLGHRWEFIPQDEYMDNYGTILMPNYIDEDMELYNMAKEKKYNLIGEYAFLYFNNKFSKSRLYEMMYAVEKSLLPSQLSEQESKNYVRRLAEKAITPTDEAESSTIGSDNGHAVFIKKDNINAIEVLVFESHPDEDRQFSKRLYADTFKLSDIRYLFFEVAVRTTDVGSKSPILYVKSRTYRDGSLLFEEHHSHEFDSGDKLLRLWEGYEVSGNNHDWKAGNYKVELYDIHQEYLGSKEFTLIE